MSEEPLGDYRGRFAQVVVDGRKLPDMEWLGGRILLSNRRLVLATGEGKRTIPLSEVQELQSRADAGTPLAAVDGYVSVRAGEDVTLVAPEESRFEEFETTLYAAVLDGATLLADHPAVEGGVVRDTDWEKAQLKVEPGAVALALTSGQFVEIEVADVGSVAETDQEIEGSRRPTLEVEHTEGGRVVETHLAGSGRTLGVLAGLLRKGEQQNETDVDLDDGETEVLMALYSGVSPFRIPEFVGMEVDRVEAIYDRLVEQGLLEERRTRREVSLQARGRHIASEASGEE